MSVAEPQLQPDQLAADSAAMPAPLFNRPPRIRPDLPEGEIEIPGPPEPPDEDVNRSRWAAFLPRLITILPMLMYAIMMVAFMPSSGMTSGLLITRVVGMLLVGLIGGLVGGGLNRADQQQQKNQRLKQLRKLENYKTRLEELEERLERDHTEQRSVLERMNPALPELEKRLPQIVQGLRVYPDNRLWERRQSDPDFLCLRAGIGIQPSRVTVTYPDRLDYVEDDEFLQDYLEPAITLGKRYQFLHDAPMLVNLREQDTVSIVGEDEKIRLGVLRAMLMQLVVHHAPNDVALYIVAPHDQARSDPRWDWARWLPHCNADLQGRMGDLVARTEDSTYKLLERLLKLLNRKRESLAEEDGQIGGQYIVLLVDDYTEEVREHPAISSILAGASMLHAAAIFVHERLQDVPSEVKALLRLDMEPTVGIWYGEVGPEAQRIPPAGWDIEDTEPQEEPHQSKRRARRPHDELRPLYQSDPDWHDVFEQSPIPTMPDNCQLADAQRFAQSLENVQLQTVGSVGNIPNYVGFLDMYNATTIQELDLAMRWSNHPEKGRLPFPVPLGMAERGKPIYLDLYEKQDGPHGLVAGTTGSGKSELLQTLVAALAVEHHPHFLSFFLVDYKGGSSFNLFQRLPHTVGVVSDLAPEIAKRALVALQSEIRFRKRVFAGIEEEKIKDIVDYHKLYVRYLDHLAGQDDTGDEGEANLPKHMLPLPHLVIIIDEFAELMAELPDFMPEMSKIARVGRSLGIHLILATQRPAGSVRDEVRANTQFTICLRVRSVEDSRDMLSQSDAAFLPNIPGRGYFKAGSNMPRLFQSGYAGDTYDPYRGDARFTSAETTAEQFTIYWGQEKAVHHLGSFDFVPTSAVLASGNGSQAFSIDEASPGPDTDDSARYENAAFEEAQLTRISGTVIENLVAYIHDFAEKLQGYEPLKKLWQEPLPEDIVLDELLGRRVLEQQVEQGRQSHASPAERHAGQIAMQQIKQIEQASPEEREVLNWQWTPAKWAPDAASTQHLIAILGLLDDPAQRRQERLEIDFADPNSRSHLAIYGGPGTGKSNLLRTMIASMAQLYGPWQFQVQIFDYGVGNGLRPLLHLPHVGTYANPTDEARARRLIYWLAEEAHRRSQLSGDQAADDSFPILLILIDNFDGFSEQFGGAGRFEVDTIVNLAQNGPSLKIFLLISAGNNIREIAPPIIRATQHRIAFRMNEAEQMQLVLGGRPPYLSEDAPTGRAMWRGSPPLEVQTAYIRRGADMRSAEMDLKQLGQAMQQALVDEPRFTCPPHRIGELGKRVALRDLLSAATRDPQRFSIPLGVKYTDLQPAMLQLRRNPGHVFVVGGAESGKTTVLHSLALSAAACYSPEEVQLVLIAPGGSTLDALEALPHVGRPVAHTVEEIRATLAWMQTEFEARQAHEGGNWPYLLIIVDDSDLIFDSLLGAGRPQPGTLAELGKNDFQPAWAKRGANFHMHFVFSYLHTSGPLRFGASYPFLDTVISQSTTCLTSPDKAEILSISAKITRDVDFSAVGRGFILQQPENAVVLQFATPDDDLAAEVAAIGAQWEA